MAAKRKAAKKKRDHQLKNTLPISELLKIGNPDNPRKPMQGLKFDALRGLHAKFGSVQDVVINRRTVEKGWPEGSHATIVGGHQRVQAAAQEGFDEYPVTYIDVGESDEQELNIGLNNVMGEWEDVLLKNMLQRIESLGGDLSMTGFDEDELRARLRADEQGDGEDDRDPDAPVSYAPARCEDGDIWLLGDHRLMCGDCRSEDDVVSLLDGNKINLAFTSPPYASQRDYDETSGFRPIPSHDYVKWFEPVQEHVRNNIEIDGSWFVNIKPTSDGVGTQLYVLDLVLAHAREWGWHFGTELCWERNGVPKQVTQRFKNQFEPIYQFALGKWKMRPDDVRHESANVPIPFGPGGDGSWHKTQGTGASIFAGQRNQDKKGGQKNSMSGVQVNPNVSQQPGEFVAPGLAYPGNRLPTFSSTHSALGHPAAFPVGLPEFFIRAYSDPSDVIYDPFMGSGSTLIAAERAKRRGFGIEISKGYCDIIIARWEEFAQRDAVKYGS